MCFSSRIAALQKTLVSKKIGCFLVSDPDNLFYLTGCLGMEGKLVVTQKEAVFFTDQRYAGRKTELPNGITPRIERSVFGALLSYLGSKPWKQRCFETTLSFGEKTFIEKKLGKPLTPYSQIVEQIRLIKDSHEIALMKKVALIADKAFAQTLPTIKSGQTEQAIAWQLEKNMRELGADGTSFAPIVASGPNSAIPHHATSSRKVRKGEFILMDFGAKKDGYCSDMTRMVSIGKPTKEQLHDYDLVLSAKTTAQKAVSSGAKGNELDELARTVFRSHEAEELFTHSLGHGVGIAIHETPILSSMQKDVVLKENMVVTIEPGIYREGKWGVRIEDTVVVGKRGCVTLTKSPLELCSIHTKL